ncbi:hypothetical protein ACF1FX_22000 [Streptomyces sp. NPDC014646]|uniref:hypothetical protein n=1 Tax=Streptomyces sp. NPDC014646 TaxID=3364877 RepID=UPI0036FE82BD
MKVFGFINDDSGNSRIAPLPDEVRDQVESTVTLSGGQSWTDAKGNTYTTTRSDDD